MGNKPSKNMSPPPANENAEVLQMGVKTTEATKKDDFKSGTDWKVKPELLPQEKEAKEKQLQEEEATLQRRLKRKLRAEVAKSINLTNTADVSSDEKKTCKAEQCLDLVELINDSYLSNQNYFFHVIKTVKYKQALDGVKWTIFQEQIYDRIRVYEALLGAWLTKRELKLSELETFVETLINGWTVRCRIVAPVLRDLIIERRGVVVESGSVDIRKIIETVEKDFADKDRVTIAQLAEYLHAKNYFQINADDDKWILSTTAGAKLTKASQVVSAKKPKTRASFYMRNMLAAGPLRTNYEPMLTPINERPKPAEALPAMQVDMSTATKCVDSTTSLPRANKEKMMGPITTATRGGFEEVTEKEKESFQKACYASYILLRQWGNDNDKEQKMATDLLKTFLSTKQLPNSQEAVEILKGIDHILHKLSPDAYNTRWKMSHDDWENANRLLKRKVDGLKTGELPEAYARQLLMDFKFSCLRPTTKCWKHFD